jgi:hypothetical protein
VQELGLEERWSMKNMFAYIFLVKIASEKKFFDRSK